MLMSLFYFILFYCKESNQCHSIYYNIILNALFFIKDCNARRIQDQCQMGSILVSFLPSASCVTLDKFLRLQFPHLSTEESGTEVVLLYIISHVTCVCDTIL